MIGSLKWPCISETSIIMEGARCGIHLFRIARTFQFQDGHIFVHVEC